MRLSGLSLPKFLPPAEKMAVQNLKIALVLRHQTNLYVKLLDVPGVLFIIVIQADRFMDADVKLLTRKQIGAETFNINMVDKYHFLGIAADDHCATASLFPLLRPQEKERR